jgi:hypothetical protein
MPARGASAGFFIHRISGVAHMLRPFYAIFSVATRVGNLAMECGWRRAARCPLDSSIRSSRRRLDPGAGAFAVFPGAPPATPPGTNKSASIWGAAIAAALLK